MASPVNERGIGDAELAVTGTLPNAANTTYTNIIDLSQAVPFPTTGEMWLKIVSTAATGANDKNINIRLQHSNDTNVSNMANVAGPANPLVQTTSANDVHPALSNIFSMPTYGLRRYIRAAALGEANGADSGDGTFTLSVLF